eukprot:1192852-Prorocentrum_minimum.AAC.2
MNQVHYSLYGSYKLYSRKVRAVRFGAVRLSEGDVVRIFSSDVDAHEPGIPSRKPRLKKQNESSRNDPPTGAVEVVPYYRSAMGSRSRDDRAHLRELPPEGA